MLKLTPAYDIGPQPRSGNEASQAMLISGDNRMSWISARLEAAHHFLLSEKKAAAIVEDQISAISKKRNTVCEKPIYQRPIVLYYEIASILTPLLSMIWREHLIVLHS